MDVYGQIARRLKEIVGKSGSMPFFYGEVVRVDGDRCSVKVEGLELSDVALSATLEGGDGRLVVEPQEGSMVLVGDLSSGEMRQLVVLRWSEVAKVRMDGEVAVNGGENGGAVNVEPLKRWMRQVESDLKRLSTLLKSSPIAGNGAPAGIAFSPTVRNVEREIEDQQIKH